MENTTKTEDLRKELVKQAKMRMLKNDYDALAANDTSEIELPKGKDSERLQNYMRIVREIRESDTFVSDPLRRMMDVAYYDSLPENKKMGYMLTLSKIYKELVAQYEKA